MIELSATARRHVRELAAHYRRKQRPEALKNLISALSEAQAVIARGSQRSRDHPATYRDLARPGRARVKAGRYWIAYDLTTPPVIAAVFWEGANIERRYPSDP